jgi:hypothetical protein
MSLRSLYNRKKGWFYFMTSLPLPPQRGRTVREHLLKLETRLRTFPFRCSSPADICGNKHTSHNVVYITGVGAKFGREGL